MISGVAVVIPACNEQDHIGDCLDSVFDACAQLRRHHRRALPTRVVVVLDACVDDTAAVLARYPEVTVAWTDAACVGTSRRLAAATAIALFGSAPDTWLASTDADCTVPRDWLVRMVGHADAGHDLVLGTVAPSPGLDAAHAVAWREQHDSADGHPHVHGANLGIRADTYLRLGGWPPLRTGEDVALVDRAVSADSVRVHRSGDPSVITSSRLTSRVEHGFAGFLRALVQDGPRAHVIHGGAGGYPVTHLGSPSYIRPQDGGTRADGPPRAGRTP